MAVNERTSVDQRAIGKLRVRHSFLAFAIYGGLLWGLFFFMFRAVGERDLPRGAQVLMLTVLGLWILVCLYLAFAPPRKKLTAETFAQLLKKHHLPVRKAEQIEGGPYDSLPGCKSVCHYIPDNESASRALSRLSFDAGNRNVEVIDRLGIISVYFFPSQKKASMAWKTFSAAGGQADRAAAQVIFPYQNAPIDYNGRDEAVRAALESLRRETLADGQKL